MRTRTRTYSETIDKMGTLYRRTDYKNPSFTDTVTDQVLEFSYDSFTSKDSTITDSVTDYFPKRKRGRKQPAYIKTIDIDTGKTGSTRLKASKECTHTKTETSYEKDVTVKCSVTYFAGNATWEQTRTSSFGFRSGRSVFPYLVAGSANPFGTPTNGNGGGFASPDWFSLVDSFTELTEQYIPNQMLLGETIAEGSIYLDALKAVISPGRALTSLLKNLVNTKFRTRNLGEISKASKALGKDAASSYLGYHFAVKPALDDIRAMLSAHKIVTQRLKWLSTNGGKWVPLRVRSKLPAVVSPMVIPNSANAMLFTHMSSKERHAVISGFGQIRESPSGDAAWQAYYQYFGLNKILGLAWELVPFSFVLDWVTNTQEAVNYFSRLSTGSPYVGIAGITSSIKDKTELELRLKGGYIGWLNDYTSSISASESIVIGRRSISAYTRLPRIPTGYGVVDFSTLGTFHASIGGALAVQLGSKRIR